MSRLIIIRGLPGSGKSTLAEIICAGGLAEHFEADMFFVDERGNYNFDASRIREAHTWCQKKTREALVRGSDVVVSNTFVAKWEVEVYVNLANEIGASICLYTADNAFRNTHSVPKETIKRMTSKWVNFEYPTDFL
jgi:predicted kinase